MYVVILDNENYLMFTIKSVIKLSFFSFRMFVNLFQSGDMKMIQVCVFLYRIIPY